MNQPSEHDDAKKEPPDHVAGVLAALGDLMRDLHMQDLALQSAVSQLADASDSSHVDVAQIQHIDLVTQTHEDLARFLPELAACLEDTEFKAERLAKILRLQSLREQLLDTEMTPSDPKQKAGDLSLF